MHKMSENGNLTINNLTVIEETDDVYISSDKLKIFMLLLAVLLIPMFCLLGSVGNVISLRVLFHQRMRNQTNYMLAALCISDTLFLVHCLIFISLNIYKKINPVEGESLRAKVYPVFGAYGSVVTARITSCLTTLLCVERFVAVYYPMQAKFICSKKNTVIAIIVIYIVTLLAFIPFSLKYRTVEDVGNSTMVYLNKTQFYLSNVKFFSIYGSLLNILFRFSPLVIIPVLNICMVRAVHQTWKLRREMSGHQDGNSRRSNKGVGHYSSTDQHRITVMLVTVAFVFFLCILPGAINSIMTHIIPAYSRIGKYKNLYLCLSTVTFLFETINSSVNFIIYMAMCRKFRLLYKEIFCCGHGQYYSKISVSSVKDRFKWVSSKKRSDSDSNDKCSCRAVVSDYGPIRNKSIVKKRSFNGIHSEGYAAPDRESSSSSSTNRTPWTVERKVVSGYKQSDDSTVTLNGDVGCTCISGQCRKLKDKDNETPNLSKACRKKHVNTCHSKRHHKLTKDTKAYNGTTDKRVPHNNGNVTINFIYAMDQEIPLITESRLVQNGKDNI